MSKSNNRFQQTIDFGRLFKPITKYWYLIALSVGLSILLAWLYLNQIQPVYEMQATILVQNNEEDGLTKDALQKEILGMGSDPEIYEDVRILRSRTLMEAIKDSLQAPEYLQKSDSGGAWESQQSIAFYLNSFAVGFDKNQPTIIDLYIRDEVPDRGLNVLQKIIQTYNEITLENKSSNRRNTLEFIEERIDLLVAELNRVELELERYKTKESLTVDFKADLPYIQERIGYFEREIVNVEIQRNMMEYISNTLDSNAYQFFPLVDFGLEHKGLSGLIMQYNNLIQERNQLRRTVTENYPALQLIDEKINTLKISIQEEVTKNLSDLDARLNGLKTKNQTYLDELNATPRRERELLDKQRQQATKEGLYKYLLEKREEAALSIAAVGANASIVDQPYVKAQVGPKKLSILMGAAIAGFVLPFGVILLLTLLDKKVRYKEEVLEATDTPFLGSIVAAGGRNKLLMQNGAHLPAAESFRSLRTNLDLFLDSEHQKVLVLTSAGLEEGKSFTAANLSLSYALSGRKTLLIDLDLRNPQIGHYLREMNAEPGIADYLAGQASIGDIIQLSEQHPALNYISSGQLSAHSADLLTNERIPTLLDALKDQYERIILDTPAVGLVSDALHLARFADVSLYLVRIGKTAKEDLNLLQELKDSGKLSNPALVLNGVGKGRTYRKALKKGYYQK